MFTRFASNWAQALFRISYGDGRLRKCAEDLHKLDRSNYFWNFILNHQYSFTSKKKIKILNKVLGKEIYGPLLNLICLIIEKRRELDLKSIFFSFFSSNDGMGTARVGIIYSSVVLHKEKIEEIEQIIKKRWEINSILVNEVKPQLVAGIRVEIADIVLEDSIARRLQNIENFLLKKWENFLGSSSKSMLSG